MNRNNIWVHIGLAVGLITLAAVIGQIDRWKGALRTPNEKRPTRIQVVPTATDTKLSPTSDAEVLVRFRQGVDLSMIKALAAKNHDQVVDEIESVDGLVAIDDLDNASPETVAAQYSELRGAVSYAEPNFQIELDDPATGGSSVDVDSNTYEPGLPNDPQFGEQWALNNVGQNGGKE